MTPTDVPSLNAVGARLHAAAADLSAAVAAGGADIDERACPRHLRPEAAAVGSSATVLAEVVAAAAGAITAYAHAVAGLDTADRELAAAAERLGFMVTADRIEARAEPRNVAGAEAEAARAADLARLNRRRLALHEQRARADDELVSALARQAAAAEAVADRLR